MTVVVDVRQGKDGATQDQLDIVALAINKALVEANFKDVRFGVRGTYEKAISESDRSYEGVNSLYDELSHEKPELFNTPVVVITPVRYQCNTRVFIRSDTLTPDMEDEDYYRSHNARHDINE